MSLSRFGSSDSNLTGKVVMGMTTPGPDEMSIQELEGKRQLLWDDETNEEYLNRVREKAKDAAKEIKLLAELEAEALRATSRHEGYNEGLAQAQETVDMHINEVSTKAEALLSQLGAQGSTIFEDRRADIMNLIRLAVHKTIGIELDEQRAQSLENLLQEGMDRLDSQRELTIKCHPEDVQSLEEFMTAIQERNPALKYWKAQGDPSITAGGVVIEGASAKVDNTVDSRWASVEPIFEQLVAQVTAEGEG